MGRSEAGREKHLAARRAWGRTEHGRAYMREWRKRHREAERDRKARWRKANPDKLRAQWARRSERNQVDTTPLPVSHSGHPLFDEAWAVLQRMGIRRDEHLQVIHDQLWEEACSEAVLAIIQDRDPEAAVRAVLATERRFRIMHLPMPEYIAA